MNSDQLAATITGLNGEALVGDILLLREGDENDPLAHVVVYVNRQGVWYEAIRELASFNMSHTITSYGLLALKEPAKGWLNEGTS